MTVHMYPANADYESVSTESQVRVHSPLEFHEVVSVFTSALAYT